MLYYKTGELPNHHFVLLRVLQIVPLIGLTDKEIWVC
jgi:hypothetical protein